MKILQVITLCELGGAQSVVSNLSNELVARGHEVIVAAGEGDGKMFDLLDPRVVVERVPSLVRRLSPCNEPKAIYGLRQIYKKYNPDIIHLHSSKAGILGRIAFPKRKTVYTVHGFDSIRLAYRRFLPLERILQNRCAAIAAVSQYDVDNLLAEGITHNVRCIYNGIKAPQRLASNPFARMQTSDSKVLCIARFSPPKKMDLFAEVAALMPECSFIWIGNQEEPTQKFPNNVTFMGNIPGAGAYTRYADVFMLPSNYEGLPMVIIEALACGTPVVASAVGGIPELLDGANGYAVENNAAKMADKIREVLNARKQSDAMSERAVETYRKSFTVFRMADEYEKLYNDILLKI